MKRLITVILGLMICTVAYGQITIAIDAGHGGKDSGAIGFNKLYEKNVTFAIAKKLAALLKKDGRFRPILTRTRDHFILVSARSEIARQHKANLLISIHADAAPIRSAHGASVWLLSTKRADTELGRWLEQHEKQSQLLGGVGHALSGEKKNPFLSQAILDLQFSNSQRVGYDLAQSILKALGRVTKLHKAEPGYASLGVLRSPDIPSVLIETGFISNVREEAALRRDSYQNTLADAIYEGIKNYIKSHPNIGTKH